MDVIANYTSMGKILYRRLRVEVKDKTKFNSKSRADNQREKKLLLAQETERGFERQFERVERKRILII